ncbi:hypothetical protein SNEBB_006198 [Seison nebaliae]|nr:hypothetical protein SNEBB_006198 [Seison nebaliae]
MNRIDQHPMFTPGDYKTERRPFRPIRTQFNYDPIHLLDYRSIEDETDNRNDCQNSINLLNEREVEDEEEESKEQYKLLEHEHKYYKRKRRANIERRLRKKLEEDGGRIYDGEFEENGEKRRTESNSKEHRPSASVIYSFPVNTTTTLTTSSIILDSQTKNFLAHHEKQRSLGKFYDIPVNIPTEIQLNRSDNHSPPKKPERHRTSTSFYHQRTKRKKRIKGNHSINKKNFQRQLTGTKSETDLTDRTIPTFHINSPQINLIKLHRSKSSGTSEKKIQRIDKNDYTRANFIFQRQTYFPMNTIRKEVVASSTPITIITSKASTIDGNKWNDYIISSSINKDHNKLVHDTYENHNSTDKNTVNQYHKHQHHDNHHNHEERKKNNKKDKLTNDSERKNIGDGRKWNDDDDNKPFSSLNIPTITNEAIKLKILHHPQYNRNKRTVRTTSCLTKSESVYSQKLLNKPKITPRQQQQQQVVVEQDLENEERKNDKRTKKKPSRRNTNISHNYQPNEKGESRRQYYRNQLDTQFENLNEHPRIVDEQKHYSFYSSNKHINKKRQEATSSPNPNRTNSREESSSVFSTNIPIKLTDNTLFQQSSSIQFRKKPKNQINQLDQFHLKNSLHPTTKPFVVDRLQTSNNATKIHQAKYSLFDKTLSSGKERASTPNTLATRRHTSFISLKHESPSKRAYSTVRNNKNIPVRICFF